MQTARPKLSALDAAPMCGIAQPALLIRRFRSNAMFRKFGLRIFLDFNDKGGPVVNYLKKYTIETDNQIIRKI
jgi:hypothetical protein